MLRSSVGDDLKTTVRAAFPLLTQRDSQGLPATVRLAGHAILGDRHVASWSHLAGAPALRRSITVTRLIWLNAEVSNFRRCR